MADFAGNTSAKTVNLKMARNSKIFTRTFKEVFFQVLLHIVLFLFYTFDKHQPQIQGFKMVAFLNYAMGALVINYVLLPYFFYKKKYSLFFLSSLAIIATIILVEELVLEKIFYPTTRGKHFPGIIYSLLDVMPIVTILVGFKFAWDASIKQREVEELRTSAKESELQFLKSQINPHFLFNNLNNLYSYALEKSPKTPTIILELSTVLRYMLYDCKEDFVALPKEIENLRNFTQLNELQIEERGTVSFRTKNINPEYRIAPLILTVFVENAFKHSTASQSKDIVIDIEVKVTNGGMLEFKCNNSFQPLGNTENLSKGIGLENVKKRLQILYPDAHQLKIDETNGQYRVCLKIRLKTEGE
ncbi:histidine kinase [Flavobacteriaceae bacterium F89]|uniref:Histidine kinase n=1 Tax=Cerina litoralis TaxID=2874477 RepID=A0AAE3EQE2_9FLAO|nr:histidine kinase [Cerina litoralis]MCG2459162.1 histidine kinase [Cerina litoralis]